MFVTALHALLFPDTEHNHPNPVQEKPSLWRREELARRQMGWTGLNRKLQLQKPCDLSFLRRTNQVHYCSVL